MPYFLLILSFILFLPGTSQFKANSSKEFLNFPLSSLHFNKSTYSLYQASITGDKTNLSRKLKHIFKRYGLLHLLTPSGLHLSSLYFLLGLFNKWTQSALLGVLFLIVAPLGGYLSLERVILFKILGLNIRLSAMTKLIFILILSLLSHNYQSSPLSFCFSLLFWGTIILFKDNKLKLMLLLNLSLHITSSIFDTPVKSSSLFINPLITSIMTFIFPLLFFNYLVGGFNFLNEVIHNCLNLMVKCIYVLDKFDPTPLMAFSLLSLLAVALFIHYNRYKTALIILLLQSNHSHQIQQVNSNFIFPAHRQEIVKEDFEKKDYIDQRCRFGVFKISCKKKPSHLGGPSI
ncbi:MAG: hypothetical protein CME62_08065 [Halobacteriovoraceae bacterium]|nr:hypothetical protein [Halobacteriovoraceae bacterium]|tara:strand:- start:4310 stop:5347 length:1038 start_codon:yes stop_codon:yes gene_type:complete